MNDANMIFQIDNEYIVIGYIASFLFTGLTLQVIFSRVGESGWKAWVPFLNAWTFFRAASMSGFWMFSLIVPILGLIMLIIASYKITENLGRSGVVGVLLFVLINPLWFLVYSLLPQKEDEEPVIELHPLTNSSQGWTSQQTYSNTTPPNNYYGY